MHYCQGKSRGYCGIDRIASSLHDVNANLGGQGMHADHHGMLRAHGMGRGGRRKSQGPSGQEDQNQ
jgi:hypothetical protein